MLKSVNNRILLIEDDKDTREIYAFVLEAEGFTVDTAADGATGLERAKTGGYALILLDLMMPKVDGLHFLAELKRSPPREHNGPIVIITNLSHVPVIEEAKKLGASAYFVKAELTPATLVKKVQAIIKASPPEEPQAE